jgi:hypothetical protein
MGEAGLVLQNRTFNITYIGRKEFIYSGITLMKYILRGKLCKAVIPVPIVASLSYI